MSNHQPTNRIYAPIEQGDDLQQGDVLLPTKELREVFTEVHQHFLDDKYKAFLVLTQTCDLVRNRGFDPCKSQYINLAVVRPIEDVLFALLDVVCEPVKLNKKRIKGFYTSQSKNSAERLLGRIINQNEDAMGIFYLPPDTSVKIAYHSVALLQVNIALRSKEHYGTCVDARRGRLDPVYRDRLGWIIGNLFSRIATDDVSNKQKGSFIKSFLGPSDYIEKPPKWTPKESIDYVKKTVIDARKMGDDEIISILTEHKPEPPIEIALRQVMVTVSEATGGITEETAKNIEDRLRSDDIFKAVLKGSPGK